MSDAADKRQGLAQRLMRGGMVLLVLFLVLYSTVIVAFGSWQNQPLPVAWIGNLTEGMMAMPLGLLFWIGLAALVVGLLLRSGMASGRHR